MVKDFAMGENPRPCSSLVLHKEGKLLPSVTPGAYHKMMHLLMLTV